MIDRATIDKILDTARIEEVIGDFVSLRRRGANYVACCPFHHEKTPSFTVSPSKGIFKCFGCGKAGNVVTFVMEHEHMSYVEALKFIGKKYGIEVTDKEESAEDVERRLLSESLLIVNEFAEKYYSEQLWDTPGGRAVGISYFRERGFTDDTIRKFKLGFAPAGRDGFTYSAIKAGYKKEHLTTAGLSVKRENGEYADRFFERVMFPWHSISGKTIAFGGRILTSDKHMAKYVNSPESVIYEKNKSLYGIFEAKGAISKEQKCYLVEGYTDVISFSQAGVENVVSSGGTSLTTGQIGLIKRFSNKITVLYDGDSAGIKASLRGIDMLLEEGMEVKVALFPNGEDPDSFARKHTASELRNFLSENEEDFIAFKYRLLNDETGNDPLRRANLIREIVKSIAVIPDAIIRNVYIEETSSKLSVDQNMLSGEVGKIIYARHRKNFFENRRAAEAEKENVKTEDPGKDMNLPSFVISTYCEEAEKEILYYLIKFGKSRLVLHDSLNIGSERDEGLTVGTYILSELQNDELELQNLVYKNIFDEYFSLREDSQEKIIRHFVNHPDGSVSQVIVNLLAEPYTLSIKSFRDSVVPESNVLGMVVPKAVLVYKAKITSQACLKICRDMEKAQKDRNSEKETALMGQLNILNKIKTRFLKELKRTSA
ncbi:MAG: DNA primase [Bacteroidales bacterium]|jgi:DNA primase|nr:DNA primase [Bacteroidales bacterium]